MTEGSTSAPTLMALLPGIKTRVEYEANLVSYFDSVIMYILGVTEPPQKWGVRLPRSYRGILDEARMRKHNT
jgi:hypothetical protein